MKDKSILHLIMFYYVFDVICAHDVTENEFIELSYMQFA